MWWSSAPSLPYCLHGTDRFLEREPRLGSTWDIQVILSNWINFVFISLWSTTWPCLQSSFWSKAVRVALAFSDPWLCFPQEVLSSLSLFCRVICIDNTLTYWTVDNDMESKADTTNNESHSRKTSFQGNWHLCSFCLLFYIWIATCLFFLCLLVKVCRGEPSHINDENSWNSLNRYYSIGKELEQGWATHSCWLIHTIYKYTNNIQYRKYTNTNKIQIQII